MNKTKLLITGSNGQLGSEIRCLSNKYLDFEYQFTDVATLDICSYEDIQKYFLNNKIDCIINCASYTNVDKAETEPSLAEQVNSFGVKNLVKVCSKHSIKLVHISTDYVFDGTSSRPYKESDCTNPINVYGRTKAKGEDFITKSNLTYAIIRTAWLYSSFGNNFAKTISRLAQERDEIDVVNDQIGTPTNAKNLATVVLKIIPKLNNDNKGIYHYTGDRVMSWYDFAKEIVQANNLQCKVKPIKSKYFKTIAKRPMYSVLDCEKIKHTLLTRI